MAKIYLHCGLHKTGTTALQIALTNHADRLREAGFLYPFAGRLGNKGGQHNLAWQIARDRRFDKRRGNIDALLAEIGDYRGNIILSSEDFESSLDRPAAFTPFLEYARKSAKELVLVIYLRNQIAYLESLYQEMLKHGFGEEYELCANDAISHGKIRIQEWVFHFDYMRIAEAFSTMSGVKLIFRNFHSVVHKSLVLDFASVVGIDPSLFADAINVRANERDSYARSLYLFYENRVGRPLNRSESDAVDSLCAREIGSLETIGNVRNLLIHKFLEGSACICQKYDIPGIGLSLNDDTYALRSRNATSIEKFFSFETHNALKELAPYNAQRRPLDDEIGIKSDAQRLGDAWFNWVRSA